MRFMVIVKATPQSEAGILPTAEEFNEMGRFNEQLAKAGVMLAGEGLQPTSKGARIKFEDGKTAVTDGPFAETKELIAGYWLIQTRSKAEAIEWMSRAPFDGGTEIELRRIYETEDFGDAATPEMLERENRLRAEIDAR